MSALGKLQRQVSILTQDNAELRQHLQSAQEQVASASAWNTRYSEEMNDSNKLNEETKAEAARREEEHSRIMQDASAKYNDIKENAEKNQAIMKTALENAKGADPSKDQIAQYVSYVEQCASSLRDLQSQYDILYSECTRQKNEVENEKQSGDDDRLSVDKWRRDKVKAELADHVKTIEQLDGEVKQQTANVQFFRKETAGLVDKQEQWKEALVISETNFANLQKEAMNHLEDCVKNQGRDGVVYDAEDLYTSDYVSQEQIVLAITEIEDAFMKKFDRLQRKEQKFKDRIAEKTNELAIIEGEADTLRKKLKTFTGGRDAPANAVPAPKAGASAGAAAGGGTAKARAEPPSNLRARVLRRIEEEDELLDAITIFRQRRNCLDR